MIREVITSLVHDPEFIRVNLFGVGGVTLTELAELKMWFGIAVAVSVIIYNITKAVIAGLEFKRKGKSGPV